MEQSENNSSEGTSSESEELGLYQIHQVKKGSTPPVRVEVRVNSKPLKMEVDTGAAVSIISQKTWQEVFPLLPIEKSNVVLTVYS